MRPDQTFLFGRLENVHLIFVLVLERLDGLMPVLFAMVGALLPFFADGLAV